jgi:hypothetical protein
MIKPLRCDSVLGGGWAVVALTSDIIISWRYTAHRSSIKLRPQANDILYVTQGIHDVETMGACQFLVVVCKKLKITRACLHQYAFFTGGSRK